MRYFYKEIEVKLVPGQKYSTHWNFFFPTDVGGNVVMYGQPGIDLIWVEDKEITIFEIKSIGLQTFAKIHVPFEEIVKWVNAITGLGVNATIIDVKIIKIDRHIDDWIDIHFQGAYDQCLEIFNQYKQEKEKEKANLSHQNHINEKDIHSDNKIYKYSEFGITDEEYESFAIAISEDLEDNYQYCYFEESYEEEDLYVEDKYQYSYCEKSYEEDEIVSKIKPRYLR